MSSSSSVERSTPTETKVFLDVCSVLSGDELDSLISDRTLAARCIGCTLISDELHQSDAERAAKIIDDALTNCPYTSGYMGAVVRSCVIDSRHEQDKLDINRDLYERGIY